MTAPGAPLLNAAGVAARLGISRWHAYKLMERGEIAVTRIGRAVRVSEESLAAYIAARTSVPRRTRRSV